MKTKLAITRAVLLLAAALEGFVGLACLAVLTIRRNPVRRVA